MIDRAWRWLKTRMEPQDDPVIEQWARGLAVHIAGRLSSERDQFDLQRILAEYSVAPQFEALLADRTYRLFLRRAWSDGAVTDGELRTLAWIGNRLGLASTRVRDIDLYTASRIFYTLCKRALADGHIDVKEAAELLRIAENIRMPITELATASLREYGRNIIDDLADLAARSEQPLSKVWNGAVTSLSCVGLSHEVIEAAMEAHVRTFTNDLIDAISVDGILTDPERNTLTELFECFDVPARERKRVWAETEKLATWKSLHDPSIDELAQLLREMPPRGTLELSFSNPASALLQMSPALVNSMWWQVTSASDSGSAKYQAGAQRLVSRASLSSTRTPPRLIKYSGTIFGLQGHFGSLYFLPVGVLQLQSPGVTAFSYSDLAVEPSTFVESNPAPAGAEVVGHTWQFVNKDGGPDARFKENPRLPLCRYCRIGVPGLEIVTTFNRLSEVLGSAR